jgi:hypothetical protein
LKAEQISVLEMEADSYGPSCESTDVGVIFPVDLAVMIIPD